MLRLLSEPPNIESLLCKISFIPSTQPRLPKDVYDLNQIMLPVTYRFYNITDHTIMFLYNLNKASCG